MVVCFWRGLTTYTNVENDVVTLYARASALAGRSEDVAALKKAFSLFSRAAQQGDGASLEALAEMLEVGKGVPCEPDRAAEFYGLAWQDGSPTAARRLGHMLADGLVQKDVDPEDRDIAALEMFSDAAAVGDLSAMLELAMFKLHGRGGPRDRNAAKILMQRAALLGLAAAAYELGKLYVDEGELAQAWAWFAMAGQIDSALYDPARVQIEQEMEAAVLIAGYSRLLALMAEAKPRN